MLSKLKIAVFDHESSPQLGYYFGKKWETNIVKTIEYETIICTSVWDSETDKVKNIAQWDFPDWKKGKWNDKSLVKYLADKLKDYDIIAGQNSDQFDIKLLNSRLAYWGLSPLPEYKTFDTKKLAKSKLHLPSFSLDDMAQFFGLGGKYHHSGLDMWFEARDGNKKAQKEMTFYCNKDVELTKDILLKVLPFTKQSGDFVQVNKDGITCPSPLCLSKRMTKSKRRTMKGGYKQQYQCQSCGSYFTPSKVIKDA